MSEERKLPEDPDSIGPGEDGYEDGLCALCGRPTVRLIVGDVEIARGEEYREPFVCNKCLLDLRGDMATELEVRRQLGTLDARVQSLDTKLWNQTLAFNVALAVGSFLAGVVATILLG
jgi:hypothetical protein